MNLSLKGKRAIVCGSTQGIGKAIALMLSKQKAHITLVSRYETKLKNVLKEWIDSSKVDVIIATGGTGVTGRDVTPEAFESLYEKPIPGFGELFRWLSYQNIKTSTMQSRATAGVANGTFLFALPGSTGACKDAWDMIIVHQLDSTHKPCNLVELMPRLMEK